MIEYRKEGSIFDSGAQVLVSPVNAVGVMGKGLALEFKKRYPHVFRVYKNVCDAGELKAGWMFVYTGEYEGASVKIIHAATKQHWRDSSKAEDINNILISIRQFMNGNPNLTSIAIPALGCGLGGLNWTDVKPMIERILGELPIDIFVYEPKARGGV